MRRRRVHRMVSVVVPVYNRATYVEQCLDSLVGQQYRPLQIVVVDDGSTDNSVAVIRGWRNRQKAVPGLLVNIIRLRKNVGYAGAMTAGMFGTKGQYIAFQDSDDYSSADRVRLQVQYLQVHPWIGMVGTSYHVIKERGSISRIKPMWLRFGPDRIRARYKKGKHCVCCGTVLFRGSLFDKYGGMNRRIVGAEDYDFIARYVAKGVQIDNLRQPLYFYRSHPGQRSRKFYGRKI